ADDLVTWKGSFGLDPATDVLSPNGWTGPYPLLFDDGTNGDATADDNVWTRTVFVEVGEEPVSFEYGIIRNAEPNDDGSTAGGPTDARDGEWFWTPPNGSFTVPACATQAITLPVLELPEWGDVDVKVEVDLNALVDTWTFEAPEEGPTPPQYMVSDGLQAHGPALGGWDKHVDLLDDGENGDAVAGDGIAYILASMIARTEQAPHAGLKNPGDALPFVFARLRDDGGEAVRDEYKQGPDARTEGVKAFVRFPGADEFVEVDVGLQQGAFGLNTFVTIPSAPE
ncbi:MAG: choice-of-anchor X domain-containing protein, partial [Myxococcota bacterium]